MKISFVTVLSLFMVLVSALNSPQLLKLKQKSPIANIIKLTNKNFERILSGPRDSHILVLLTATNPQVGCTVCTEIQPGFERIANAWFSEFPEGEKLFFARADFADGETEIFQKFQLNNVPRIYLFPPTSESAPFNKGFQPISVPNAASDFIPYIIDIIEENTQKRIQVPEEINVSGLVITFFSALATFLLVKRFKSFINSLLGSKPLWGGATVIAILFLNSGYMFNVIRGVPYVRPSRNGEIEYFSPGQQNQLGFEVQAISFVYGILAFSVVALVTKAKTVKDEKVNFIVVGFLSVIILVFFSILISIFGHKSGGYPFRLLQVWSP